MTDYNDLNNKIETIEKAQKIADKNSANLTFNLRSQVSFFACGFSYGGLLLFGFIASLIGTSLNFENNTLANTFVNTLSYLILFACFMTICLIDKTVFLNKIKKYKNYIIGVGFGLALIGVEILLNIIIGFFYQGDQNANQAIVETMFKSYPTISFVIICIIGPFCEELTYRAGLYDLIKRKNKIFAFIFEALLFAFIHLEFTDTTLAAELASFPIYIAIGGLLTLAYEKFDLPASFIAHVILNTMSFIAVMIQWKRKFLLLTLLY